MCSWPRSAASSSSTRAWPTRPRPVFADLNTNVHNYWDRGLMGLAVDPGYPTRPYVYVLYAYNHILGDAEPGPALAIGRCARAPGQQVRRPMPEPAPGHGRRLRDLGSPVAPDRERRRHERQRARPRSRTGASSSRATRSAACSLRARRRPVRVGRRGRQLQRASPTTASSAARCRARRRRSTRAATRAARTRPRRRPRVAPSGRRTCGPAATRSRSTAPSSGSIPTPAPAWPDQRHGIGASDANARRIIAYGLRNPYRFTIDPSDGSGLDRRRRLQHLGGAQPADRSRRGPAQLRLAVLRRRGGPAGVRRSRAVDLQRPDGAAT